MRPSMNQSRLRKRNAPYQGGDAAIASNGVYQWMSIAGLIRATGGGEVTPGAPAEDADSVGFSANSKLPGPQPMLHHQ